MPLRRAEELIATLPGVLSVRIVAGDSGAVGEIHVLTTNEVAPKNMVRNIESALMAQLGLRIDHRKVSIAQSLDPVRAADLPSGSNGGGTPTPTSTPVLPFGAIPGVASPEYVSGRDAALAAQRAAQEAAALASREIASRDEAIRTLEANEAKARVAAQVAAQIAAQLAAQSGQVSTPASTPTSSVATNPPAQSSNTVGVAPAGAVSTTTPPRTRVVSDVSAGRRSLIFEDVEVRRSRTLGVICRVTLSKDGDEFVGEASGQESERSRVELAARATVMAISEAVKATPGGDRSLALEGAKLIDAFDREFVFVSLVARIGRENAVLTGSCEVRESKETGAVLSVLDATNRWMHLDR
ncbi:MAG: hypothetical protein IT353_00875 [Gemmatimonadaceae bacterium]|nr:hypothetical protein [Gemmatimonadaceae bacterium]